MDQIQIAETIAATRTAVAHARAQGWRIGFVPTMGALHAGHASLIRAARSDCDFVVVSIFVNPTQFGPNEDYSRYPRTFDADRALSAQMGAALIFCPEPKEIYPDGYSTFVEVTGIQDPLCGASRPGHFRGVATVVLKLFNIVQPDVSYFGQKDAQQCAVIKRLARDLDLPGQISIQPTVREPDGLAMSSRNRYLDPTQRLHATVLYKTIEHLQLLVARGETSVALLERKAHELIEATPGARLDYARIVDVDTLGPLEEIRAQGLLALAVFFGATRLIDNATLTR